MSNPAIFSKKNFFWLGFFGILIVLGLFAIFASIRGSKQLAEQKTADKPPLLTTIINGKTLPVSKIGKLSPVIQSEIDTQRQQKNTALQLYIQQEIDNAFEPALQNIPRFTDWYYSLTGEYSRYLSAVTGDMGEYLADKMQETIFASAHLNSLLDTKQQLFDQHLTQQLQETSESLKQTLSNFLTQNELTPQAKNTNVIINDTEHNLNLISVLDKHLAITSVDIGKQVVSGLAGTAIGVVAVKGLGALVVKKTVAKVAGTSLFKTASVLLTKLMAKAAVKGGGAGTAAIGSAAICSPLGPVAVACGAVAGIATWLLVDEAFIQLDEALNRTAFEAEIRQAIINQREELKTALVSTYQTVFEQQLNMLGTDISQRIQQIEQKFVPAEAVRQ
ncbi:hypothetical protein [Beggiatoa leptomitoformis]|uniref:Uncharacterized protein n=1 Tax=Beggiatoa leptomitoformis TaxID=288004 RepID=A0A2N9YBL2_9GAMM|nr:hypothetical protein [Beggiatoa leptomitoformis]ALG66799.1 hypothetical protein AL038_02555 [Beggiatoa leptomitoformis]AUI67853.1 hypothetical protein BLE401_03490 [Beggiatoa leptomitoformis]